MPLSEDLNDLVNNRTSLYTFELVRILEVIFPKEDLSKNGDDTGKVMYQDGKFSVNGKKERFPWDWSLIDLRICNCSIPTELKYVKTTSSTSQDQGAPYAYLMVVLLDDDGNPIMGQVKKAEETGGGDDGTGEGGGDEPDGGLGDGAGGLGGEAPSDGGNASFGDSNGLGGSTSTGKSAVYVVGYIDMTQPIMTIGDQGFVTGAPEFLEDDPNFEKYTSTPADPTDEEPSPTTSAGFQLVLLQANGLDVKIKWPEPVIFRFSETKIGHVGLGCFYDASLGLTHFYSCFTGQFRGEFAGTDGSVVLERVFDDSDWEKSNEVFGDSVLNSFLIGEFPHKTEGVNVLGPDPLEPDGFEVGYEDAKVQQKGGGKSKAFNVLAPYDFLACGGILATTPGAESRTKGTLDPSLLRLANSQSVLEEKGKVPENPDGGTLPYDGTFYEALVAAPAADGKGGGGRSATKVAIPFPPVPLKMLYGNGKLDKVVGITRGTEWRPEYPIASSINIPKGTSVQKRKFISGQSDEFQNDYQDYREGAMSFPYYGSSPSAAMDSRGRSFLAIENGNGRVDLAFSPGINRPYVIVRDVTRRYVDQPSAAELKADADFKADDPDGYANTNDPDPMPPRAGTPRVVCDKSNSHIYLFFSYKKYIWVKMIPSELFFNADFSDGQLAIDAEKDLARAIRKLHTTQIARFGSRTSYGNPFNPNDFDAIQDKNGNLFVLYDEEKPDPAGDRDKLLNTYAYIRLTSRLKIAKSGDCGFSWVNVLPDDFEFFIQRKRSKICISGLSSTCQDYLSGMGPRNITCLYDNVRHVMCVFFHMYGSILLIRFPVEIFSLSGDDLKKALDGYDPHVVFGNPGAHFGTGMTFISNKEAIDDLRSREVTGTIDIERREKSDPTIVIPHRMAAIVTKHGNYRLFFVDTKSRTRSLISVDSGSTWYFEDELVDLRMA